MLTLRIARLGLVASVFLAAACSGSASGIRGGPGGSSPGASSGAPSSEATRELAACSGGATAGQVDDAVEISGDLKQSCHELVVCGGLSFRLTGAILELFARAALGTSTDSGLAFDGNGTYTTGQGAVLATSMELTLYHPTTGQLITSDLTKVESYFGGASVSVSLDSLKVKVSYLSLGPSFELLGLSAPSGPGTVTLDASAMKDALGRIKLRAKTKVDDRQGHATFVYEMTTPDTTLGTIFDGGAMPFTLDSVTGGRTDLAQTIERKTWNVSYVGGEIGALDGEISFAVKGGVVPFVATLTYPMNAEPEVKLSCP
jgi:hypothetical protein